MRRAALIAVVLLSRPVRTPAASPTDAARDQAQQVCAACHGPDGTSPNPEWPNLAGQHADYLAGQLRAFRCAATGQPAGCTPRRSGNAALMTGPAMALDDGAIKALAAYFAAQAPHPAAASAAPPAGATLFRDGKKDANIPACASCHLSDGRGDPAEGVPRLTGQQATYVAMQLRAFKDGSRSGENSARMRDVVVGLSNAEIDAVAAFVAGLR